MIFFKHIFQFLGFGLLMILCLLFAYGLIFNCSFSDLPAPHLTNSFSLDEKIEFMRKNVRQADIISIGSSITLNNIHSETITERFQSPSYVNAASWGANMKDNYSLLKILCEVYSPHTVIIASNISEFALPSKEIDGSILREYLRCTNTGVLFQHVKNFDFKYYIDQIKDKKLVRTSNHDYKYLRFDKYGAVKFDGKNFNIDKRKWNSDFEPGKIDENQYLYLDSISKFCKNRNIRILLFQSPFRQGLVSLFDNLKSSELETHTQRLAEILNEDNHVFINTNKRFWEDVFFVDGLHLNVVGATQFTTYCLDLVEETKKNSVYHTMGPKLIEISVLQSNRKH